ncbi:nuclear body protein SP140-like protein isoform X2 [Eublepharis macularius]|uniref:Nuclear body protein SP140-like protein isoform X2 n=1 Tax=Eublepharis macularius TaxID=481883 RepID=A0AA97L277_EUBMA|nr:nuclear body protein SP140-like protein isoform X2 [Eublepharis macularius]
MSIPAGDDIWKKVKLSISCAINKTFPFLHGLRDNEIISQEDFEKCEREANSNRGINEAIYNMLRGLEFNELTYRKLFCKENLDAYQDLQPIYKSLKNGKRVQKEKHQILDFQSDELNVSCGKAKGVLYKKKLAAGVSQKCIRDDGGNWYTPIEFERKGGRGSQKNWRKSIHCNRFQLKTLIEKGYLLNPPRSSPMKNKISRLCLRKKKVTEFSQLWSQAGLVGNASELTQFQLPGIPVQCGAVKGVLYKHRFVAGPLKKCIRMEERWCTAKEFVEINDKITNGSYNKDIHFNEGPLQNLIEDGTLKTHSNDCSCYNCKGIKWTENDDTCEVCKEDGFLMCCDSCPRSFHGVCHVPDASITKSKKWICTFCKIESQFSEKSSNQRDVLGYQMVPRHRLKCEFLLLKVCCQDARDFAKDPIKRIKEKLQKKLYQNVGDFIYDVQQTFSNFQITQDEKIREMIQKSQDEFEKNFKEVFSIK